MFCYVFLSNFLADGYKHLETPAPSAKHCGVLMLKRVWEKLAGDCVDWTTTAPFNFKTWSSAVSAALHTESCAGWQLCSCKGSMEATSLWSGCFTQDNWSMENVSALPSFTDLLLFHALSCRGVIKGLKERGVFDLSHWSPLICWLCLNSRFYWIHLVEISLDLHKEWDTEKCSERQEEEEDQLCSCIWPEGLSLVTQVLDIMKFSHRTGFLPLSCSVHGEDIYLF